MKNIGETIRMLREEKGEPLRKVAAYLDIDQAILSKMERGQRKPSKAHVQRLASYFNVDEKDLLTTWLGSQIVYEIQDEALAMDALKVAEEQLLYVRTPSITSGKIKNAVSKELQKYPAISKAWLFGSFARKEETYNSDVDLMLEVLGETGFSLFDLFQIQEDLTQTLGRKTEVVLKGALKDFAWETAKNDLKLIYDASVV